MSEDIVFEFEAPTFLHQRLRRKPQLAGYVAFTVNRDREDARSCVAQGLNRVVARHDALRMGFRESNGTFLCKVVPTAPVTVQEVFSANRERATQQAKLFFNEPLDLDQPPLLKAALLFVEGEKPLLLVKISHYISDRWGLTVFLQELNAQATGRAEPSPAPNGALPLQYSSYLRQLGGTNEEEPTDELVNQLAPARAPFSWNTSRPREAQPKRAIVIRNCIPKNLARQIGACSRDLRVTESTLLLGALGLIVKDRSDAKWFAVLTEYFNRLDEDTFGMIGLAVKSVPILFGPQQMDSVSYLRQVRLALAEAYDVPYEVWRAVNCQVHFQHHAYPQQALSAGPYSFFTDMDITDPVTRPVEVREDISLESTVRNDGAIDLHWTFDASVFSDAAVAELTQLYITKLQSLLPT